MTVSRIGRALCLLLLLLIPPTARAQNAPAATVNGETITVDEWVSGMQNLHAQDFVASFNPLRFKAADAGQVALEKLINARLLLQYAAKTSLLPTDAEVEADFQTLRKQPTVAKDLERKLYTEALLRSDVRLQKTAYNVATINERVTPEEVRDYYERHLEQWGKPERWHLAVIRASTRAVADKALADLKKGTPFAAAAKQYSEDEASRKNGGDIGTFPINDRRLPDLIRQAVKKIMVGEMTPPLSATMNAPAGTPPRTVFFIVRLIGKEEGNVKPFEQVRSEAERMALLEKVGGLAAAEKKVEAFRKTSTIVIHLPAYRELYQK